MKLIITLLLSLSLLNPKATDKENEFEGYILFENEFFALDGSSLNDEMKDMFGLQWHYTVNSENYKTLDENGKLMQLYNSATNTYYFEDNGSIKMIPASFEYPSKPRYTMSDKTEKVLGKTCKIIIEKSSEMEVTYYYHESVRTNPLNYIAHRFGSYGEFLKMSNGAIPLKIVTKQAEYTMISTAKKIEIRELDELEFDVTQMYKKK